MKYHQNGTRRDSNKFLQDPLLQFRKFINFKVACFPKTEFFKYEILQ